MTALAHKYMKWTKGLTLTVGDVELRTEQWEELLPKGEGRFDVDAIAAKLFKKAAGGKLRFAPKLIHLVLALPYEKYDIAVANSLREDVDPLKVINFRFDIGIRLTVISNGSLAFPRTRNLCPHQSENANLRP